MLNLDYVEVEIRQAKSKYKIRETGSIMKILLILLPPGDYANRLSGYNRLVFLEDVDSGKHKKQGKPLE